MLFWVIVKVGLKSLLANKLRSFLAMLGIIMGVGAVIAMLAIGAGAKTQIMNRISAMGTKLLLLWPAQRGAGGVNTGTQQNLTLADAQAILREVPGVSKVAPVVGSNAQIKYMNHNTRTRVTGTCPDYLAIRDFQVEKGRNFTDSQVDSNARVCLLGPMTAENLFDLNDPINQVVKVNGQNFTVVGVLASKGAQGWSNPDDQMIVPYTTAMQQLFGVDKLGEIDIQGTPESDLVKVQADLTAMIRKRHRTLEGAPDDINVRNQADIIATANETVGIFTMLLGSIAAISLLVGGIGIMNIMLVTVTERTREIGVRKAIGAKERSILLQFLLESMIVSFVGGAIGVLAGVGTAKVIPQFTVFVTEVTAFSVVLALSFSAIVGIFFGFYPAWRAARLDPVDALRHE
jgi:putative ABC transport system permease protein